MSGPITFTQKGSFRNTERYLRRLSAPKRLEILERYGTLGVNALSNATPIESGETAFSWSYSIVQRPGYYSIRFHNSHMAGPTPVAILIQYGHGTGTGGYVQGRDYINPVMRPIFEEMANKAWEEVTRV
jgi:hypothetical protein